MYAVIKSGGKQYKVKEGDVLRVEKLAAAEGSTVAIDEVLMVADGAELTVGRPRVAGATVSATVKAHGRGSKIKVVKFRRRKHSRKQMGHRQPYTELGITGISLKPNQAEGAAHGA